MFKYDLYVNCFSELSLSEPLARAVRELGFTTPTPIQAQALPILLGAPTDFIGLAATGTGKTAAFGLPLLEQVDASKRVPQGLVLCPTRELAMQVSGQLDLLGKHKGIKCLPIYGGADYGEQYAGLRRGLPIVVGTPGRLIDHLERKSLSLAAVKTVILDEADEMISMGFREELEAIMKGVARDKSRIWLFSATMSGPVRKMADAFLRHPKHVQVNRTEVLSATVDQQWLPARESEKPELVCKLIDAAEEFYGLVFCQTKALVMDLTQHLVARGYRADCLHGEKAQVERERTMKAFRDKKLDVLVCTDVASRGLDVKELTHVINYSIPRETELYVHRIGRTARSGKAGVAISLVTPANRGMLPIVERVTKSKIREGRIPSRREVALKKIGRILPRFMAPAEKDVNRVIELLGTDWQDAVAEMSAGEMIARFLLILAPDALAEGGTLTSLPSIAAKPPTHHRPASHPHKPAHHERPRHQHRPEHGHFPRKKRD